MLSLCAKPSAPLAGRIELFWAVEQPRREARFERVLPSGTTELVFDLCDAARPPLIFGPHSEPFEKERAERASFVGIHFRPGGAATLLGVPESEFANSRVGLDAFWGRAALELGARLAETATPAAGLRLLEDVLLARLDRARPQHPGVAYALDELAQVPAPRSIGEIGRRAGLSARRFIALFTAQVGLSPKLFARVRRFQRLLQLAHGQPKPNWLQLAICCGYCDQAHLARDFGDFAGVSPGAYVRLRLADPNHIALLPEGQIRPSLAARA